MEKVTSLIRMRLSVAIPKAAAFRGLMIGLSFFVGRILIFDTLNPLMAAYLALLFFDKYFFAAALLMGFGLITKFSAVYTLKYIFAIFVIIAARLSLGKMLSGRTYAPVLVSSAVMLISGAVLAAANQMSVYLLTIAGIEALLTLSFGLLMLKGRDFLTGRTFRLGMEEVSGISVIAAGIISGAADIHIGYFSLRTILCSLFVLAAAFYGNGGTAAAAGLLTGILMMISGYEPLAFSVVLGIAGIAAGFARNSSKPLTLLAFMFGMMISTVFLNGSAVGYELLFSVLLAGLLFFALPKLKREKPSAPLARATDKAGMLINSRLVKISGNLKRLGRTLNDTGLPPQRMVSEELFAVADILNDTCEEISTGLDFDASLERELSQALSAAGFHTELSLVIKRERKSKRGYRVEAMILLRACYGLRNCERIIPIAEEILGVKLEKADGGCVYDRNRKIGEAMCRLHLTEVSDISLSVGIAASPKTGSKVNGDSTLTLPAANGRSIIALSDGMGTGAAAKAESETALEMLRGFTEAGFDCRLAVKLINSALTLDSEKESFSTLDICTIDLNTGVSEFLKIGAAPSFICRRGEIGVVESSGLPVGILHEVDIEISRLRLEPGDFIVMVTDGIYETGTGGDNEESIIQTIENLRLAEPQEIADRLLIEAKKKSGFRLNDDMTVAVVRLT